ncbi:MAG: DUF4383 domain-containing protein [Sporichthyaceae bacterium]|nr:DUF4383 domain-containing protein [Sporichthyaceae bacterium]
MANNVTTATRTPNQLLGLVFGVVYILVGLVGFAITGAGGFAAHDGGHKLILFEINPLHNIVHLAVGALLALAAVRGAASARAVNTLVGAVYLAVGVVGLFLTSSEANILALNHPDNGLHLASALILLGIGRAAR